VSDLPAPIAPPPDGSVHLRIVCALLASAARLVPVPFVDDILRERLGQLVVRQTLKAHGRTYSSARLKPLWSDAGGGCMSGCLLMFFKVPLVLITYPFRKVWSWIMAARNLSRDLTTMILLGRALDRSLRAGRLAEGADGADLEAEAARIRQAFDNAVTGMDTQVLQRGLGDGLRQVRGLSGAALRTLRSLWKKKGAAGDADDVELPAAEQEILDEGANRVQAVLEDPSVVALLERFDARFDDNLKLLAARNGA